MLVSFWDNAVKDVQASQREKEMKDVFIMGIFDSALERGFSLPMVSRLTQLNKVKR